MELKEDEFLKLNRAKRKYEIYKLLKNERSLLQAGRLAILRLLNLLVYEKRA